MVLLRTMARVSCCVFLAILPLTLQGQQVTGSLAAIVSDKTGAVIPNASVTMKNDESADVRRSTTNNEGYFSIIGVRPGVYTVTVEAPGFAAYKVGVTFNSGDSRTLPNITLEVGTTGTEVRITDVMDQLTPVDSGEKSVVITSQQLQNVAVVSRSAAEFIKIIPGMAPTGGGITNRPGWSGENMGINGNGDGGKQSAIGNYSANGTPTAALDITMDGAHTADPGCNCATPVNPNPDMISELKVQTSNFNAENAKGPVVINAITKSGGTQFHGTGYMFARHHSMYSNDWYNNKLGLKKPENAYYFPGGNISGPVLIPGTGFNKNRDKLFFFAGYEYFKQTIDSGVLRAIVPTTAMRAGNFSDTNYLNSIGKFFGSAGADISAKYPGGIIPQSQIDPGMAALLKNVPMPNLDPAGVGQGYNWAQVLTTNQNMWQFSTKVDYNINDNTKLFVRYNRQRELQNFPIQLWWRNAGAIPLPSGIQGKNASDSIAVNFTKVLNPTLTNEFVFGHTFVDFPNSYEDYSKMTKATQNYPYKGIFKQDDKIPGFLSWSAPTAGLWLPGGFDSVLFATKHLVTISDTVAKVYGTHTFKFGGYYGKIINKQPGNDPSAGLIQFSAGHSLTTGNILADMVGGIVGDYSENTKAIVRDMGWSEFTFFAQDSWKVTKRLTIEYGLRAQHMQPWTARNGIGVAAWVPGLYKQDAKPADLSGLSWNARDKDVPLSGWDNDPIYWAPRLNFALDLFGQGSTVLRGGFGRFVYHDAQLAAGAMDLPAGLRSVNLSGGMMLRDIDNVQNNGGLVFGGETVLSTDGKQPTTDSYSLTLSQRLPQRTLVELSYVGNVSRNLVNDGGFADVNKVPLGAMLNDPTGDQNAYRPLKAWQSLKVRAHEYTSNYNSLQATLARQAGRVNFTLAYTYSKAMGVTNNDLFPFDRGQVYGALPFDRTHLFASTYVLTLPNLRRDMNPVLRGFANGWVVSGIVQMTSGVNIQPNSKDGNFGINAPNPNGDGQLNGSWIVGSPAVRAVPRLTCDPRSGLADGQHVNPSCFAPPIPGGNGRLGVNGPYVMPYMRGPAFFNADLSAFKEFAFGERKKLQLRAQAYNFLNHPISSFLDSDPNLTATFDGAGKLTNNRFGFPDNKVGRRTMMLGVKFFF